MLKYEITPQDLWIVHLKYISFQAMEHDALEKFPVQETMAFVALALLTIPW